MDKLVELTLYTLLASVILVMVSFIGAAFIPGMAAVFSVSVLFMFSAFLFAIIGAFLIDTFTH